MSDITDLIRAEARIDRLMEIATVILGPTLAREVLLDVVSEAAFHAAETFEPPSSGPAVMHSTDPWARALRTLMRLAEERETEVSWEVLERLEALRDEVGL